MHPSWLRKKAMGVTILGFNPGSGKIFLVSNTSTMVLGRITLPIKLGTGFFPRTKRPGLNSDQSLRFSAEIKNEWIYASTPHVVAHGVERDKFTCTFFRSFFQSRAN